MIQITTSDRLTLRGHHWPVAQPKTVLLLIHGHGEHAGRYAHVAAYFNQQGAAMLGFDLRGHGLSDGGRGHSPNYGQLLNDADKMLQFAKQTYPNVPVFIYGHSLGGQISLCFLLQKNPNIKGMIATAPLVDLAFRPPAIKVWLGRIVRNILPSLTLKSELNPEHLSHSPQVVAAYIADPLVHSFVSAALGADLLDSATWLQNYKGETPTPLYLLHGGDDQITSMPASRAFARQLTGDKTHHTMPGLYHEIHNEEEYPEILQKVWDWIEIRL